MKNKNHENDSKAHNRISPVQPVQAVPEPKWPPQWLAELSTKAQRTTPRHQHARGWRLADGTVLCADCHARPAGATPVALQGSGDGMVWADDLTANTDPSHHNAPGTVPAAASPNAHAKPASVPSDCRSTTFVPSFPQSIIPW